MIWRFVDEIDGDIIVDDLIYYTEPFFQDGQVAKAVDFVTSRNVAYFTAAGNFGNKSYPDFGRPGRKIARFKAICEDQIRWLRRTGWRR